MALAPNLSTTLLLLTIVVVLLPVETYAFGAGDIPDFSYLNDKAFRHGDIENILETLSKTAGGVAAGGGLLGLAHSVFQQASMGNKFTKSDIKKVYFGNWLRDYSQCMDIAGLSKLTADTLVLVVSVLGFVTFGFATEEFQVTADRLGVYLPVEHIDNPKGYAEKEGDARNFHPKLRPPVDPRELEIDQRTGMKNYMATEGRGWDTSTAFIRRTFRACIKAGRRARGQEGADLWEAYRLLGTGLHTMEDLLAHSNWCEVALRKLGHKDVFCHVGDNGADFIYSLMGEATDKLSQASVTEITQKMDQAGDGDNNINKLKNLLSKLPIGGGKDKVDQGDEMNSAAKAYHFDPNNIAPREVQQRLLQLLKWRDQVYRDMIAKIDMVPGLTNLIDEFTDALNAYVYTILSPYVVPLLQQATGVLGEGSKSVIDSEDQYEVFDNPDASDPSHSFLSKDHFDLILNEPAGKIAQLVVQNSVNLIVEAWTQDSDPDHVIDKILEAFHHPYYATGRSEIQRQMFDHMDRWIGGLGHDQAAEIIQRLTKDSVRNARNKRPGSENEAKESTNYGHSHSHSSTSATYKPPSSYQSSQGRVQYGGASDATSDKYGRPNNYRQDNQYGLNDSYNSHTKSRNEYNTESQYGSSNNQHSSHSQHDSSDNQQYEAHNDYNTGRQNRSSNNQYSSDNQQYSSSYNSHTKSRHEYNTESQYGSSNNQHSSYSQYDSSDNRQYETHNEYNTGRQHKSSNNQYSSDSQSDNQQYSSSRNSNYAFKSNRHESSDDIYGSGRTNESGNGGRDASGTYGESEPQSHSQVHLEAQDSSNYANAGAGSRYGQPDSGYKHSNDYNPETERNRYGGSRQNEDVYMPSRNTYGESGHPTSTTYGSGEGRTGYESFKHEEGHDHRRSDYESSLKSGHYGQSRHEHEDEKHREKSKHHRNKDSNDSDNSDREEGRFKDRSPYKANRHGAVGGDQFEERPYESSPYGGRESSYANSGNDGRTDYGSSGYGGRDDSSRYGGFGDNETFGVGRLKVNDDEADDYQKYRY